MTDFPLLSAMESSAVRRWCELLMEPAMIAGSCRLQFEIPRYREARKPGEVRAQFQ